MSRMLLFGLSGLLLAVWTAPVQAQTTVNIVLDLSQVPGWVRGDDFEAASQQMHGLVADMFKVERPAWDFGVRQDSPRLTITFEPATQTTYPDLNAQILYEAAPGLGGEEVMKVEQNFLGTLQGVERAEIAPDGSLVLYAKDEGRIVARRT